MKQKKTKEEKQGEIYNVVIIGGGPAGLTAALYASRGNLKPLVIEGSKAGGQLMYTTEVENFPSQESIMGPELMKKMREHAGKFGTAYLSEDVEKVDLSKRPFVIKLAEKKVLAKTLIITTGATANLLGLEAEKKLMGRGVSTCAVCDAYFYKNKEVVVVGGGDSALEEAMVLTKFANKVTLVHRRDKLRASKIMQDRAFANKKITFVWNTEVLDILGENKVTGIKLKNTATYTQSEVKCDGVFIAIGHSPTTQLFKGQLELDVKGYIVTQGRSSKTSIAGVFAAGDVTDPVYKQAVTSAGMGCMAALDAEKFLELGE